MKNNWLDPIEGRYFTLVKDDQKCGPNKQGRPTVSQSNNWISLSLLILLCKSDS